MQSILENLNFDEVLHKYTYKNQPLTSVTTMLSKTKEEFDKDYWAKHSKFSIESGLSPEQVIEVWKYKNDSANSIGTFIHQNIENFIKGLDYNEDYRIKVIREFLPKEGEKYPIINAEKRLCLPKYGLAGTCDLYLEYSDGTFGIKDWKTNDKFSVSNQYGKYLIPPPICHMQDCKLSDYTLQLSIYAYMIEELFDKTIKDIEIIWFSKYAVKTEIYKVEYKRNLVISLLNYFVDQKVLTPIEI